MILMQFNIYIANTKIAYHRIAQTMLSELIIRTLCDTLPTTQVDAVFMFGQTEDNQQSVFDSSVHLVRNDLAKKAMFIHSEAMSGYLGFASWQQELNKLGITNKQKEPVPVAAGTEQLNTHIEEESVIKLAKEKGFEKIMVKAATFQKTRAFMDVVTASLQFIWL